MRLVVLLATVLELVIRLVPKPALVLAGRILQRIPEAALVVALSLQNEIPAIAHAVALDHELGTVVGAFDATGLLLHRWRHVRRNIVDGAAGIVVIAHPVGPAGILTVGFGSVLPPTPLVVAATFEDPAVGIAVQIVEDHIHGPDVAALDALARREGGGRGHSGRGGTRGCGGDGVGIHSSLCR